VSLFFLFIFDLNKRIMEEKKYNAADDIYSKILRAGRRTYFFDVRSTKAGDYYLTISESKKFTNEDGSFYFKKHKIYLYKEDFQGFSDLLNEMTQYILDEKGLEVISEIHQKDFQKEEHSNPKNEVEKSEKEIEKENFTDVDFDDI
jgi:hypothetical protein